MSLAHDLHRAHQERLARMGVKPTQRTIEIKTPVDYQRIAVERKRAPSVIVISADEAAAFNISPIQEPVLSTPQKLKKILREVTTIHNLTVDDLISHSRPRRLAEARFEFCYRAVTETTASLPQIGRMIDRDHSTIIHAVAVYCDRHGLGYPRGADWMAPERRIERIKRANEKRRAYRAALKEMQAAAIREGQAA